MVNLILLFLIAINVVFIIFNGAVHSTLNIAAASFIMGLLFANLIKSQ